MMYDNGTVSNNIRYQDICTDKVVVNIAYIDRQRVFKIVNNTMKERDDFYPLIHDFSSLSYDHFQAIVTWLFGKIF